MELLWSAMNPNKRSIPRGSTFVDYQFPSGSVHVEIIPEASKLNVNSSPPEELNRLMIAMGFDPGRATEIALAIDDWRRPGVEGGFDEYYLSQAPSFRAPHASFQEIEELLSVRGITPDVFYGSWTPAEGEGGTGGGLVRHPGLIDCLSVFGTKDRVDANTAQPAVLAAVGVPPAIVEAILERRRSKPFTDQTLAEFVGSLGGSTARLRTEGNSIVTMRATARLRLANGQFSDLKRTVGAMVKYMPEGYDSPIHILRWYDTAWSN
jgi:general secretion pathway protein K